MRLRPPGLPCCRRSLTVGEQCNSDLVEIAVAGCTGIDKFAREQAAAGIVSDFLCLSKAPPVVTCHVLRC